MQKFVPLGCGDAWFIHWLRYAQQSAQGDMIQLDAT
jgi:hypothetical protein